MTSCPCCSIAVFYLFLPVSVSQVEVYSVTVDCTVASRFAHTVMTSKALNKASSSQEIFFEVELPKTAFITNFSMSVCHSYIPGNICASFCGCALKLVFVCDTVHLLNLSSSIFGPYREIDGQEYVGEVKEKEKAKKQYEKAVSSGQTAGLVK